MAKKRRSAARSASVFSVLNYFAAAFTVKVNCSELVTGAAPPVVALTVTVELPTGVPVFPPPPPPLELPPQEPSHSVEAPSTRIRPSILMPLPIPVHDRLRPPTTKTIPSNPGSKATGNRFTPRLAFAVGAVVMTLSVIAVALVVTGDAEPLNWQADSAGKPEQL